jgi:hypothetical protein
MKVNKNTYSSIIMKRENGNGGDKRIRTDDLLIAKQMLYQLSYIPAKRMERAKGFEPSTTTLARLYSTTELHPRYPNLIYEKYYKRNKQ